MRWLARPFFTNNKLDGMVVVEVEGGKITSAHGIVADNPPEFWGLRHQCGGNILEPKEWQPIPYDVFVSLGANMNNTIIRLVEGGYIGRRLSWVQQGKIPEGYCRHCLEKDNLYDRPIVGTDKKLYCNRCLRPFDPVLRKS